MMIILHPKDNLFSELVILLHWFKHIKLNNLFISFYENNFIVSNIYVLSQNILLSNKSNFFMFQQLKLNLIKDYKSENKNENEESIFY